MRSPEILPGSKRNLAIGLWFLVLFSILIPISRAATTSETFDEANRLFERGKFSEAAQTYERLVAAGQTNATVYFNLGTSWLHAGRVGLAIHALNRAHRLAPNDSEISNNLRIARLKTGVKVQESFEGLLSILPLNAWALLAALGTSIWFAVRAYGELLGRNSARHRSALILSGSFALLLIAATMAVIRAQLLVRSVVVITPEAVVRRGPIDESAAVFTPADGIELTVIETKNDWLKVRDVDGQEGWVLASQVRNTSN